MQPAVTNTQISYPVPEGVTVTSAPKGSVPPIFIGERMIVYAILHQSSLLAEPQEGSIRLSGDLLGATVEHNLKFQVPVSVTKESLSQVSTIHHLAAKKLIKEMELHAGSGNNDAELIQLSCDSNVICSRTAFIAIDEERKEAVKGSLETWDILADVEYECSSLVTLQPSLGMGSPKTKKLGGNLLNLMAPKRRLIANHTQHYYAEQYYAETKQYNRRTPLCAVSNTFSELDHFLAPDNPLSTVINLQLANGSWGMSEDLARVVGQPTTKIQEACPVPCKGAMCVIWATIIVLSYLQLRQSNFKDEWELIARKAETWITKQNLPEGCSIQVLREKGTAFFS